jgi:hypothetical protein
MRNGSKTRSKKLGPLNPIVKLPVFCGADIIALRKIEVESTDYAQREYAATREQIAALDEATDKRYRNVRKTCYSERGATEEDA